MKNSKKNMRINYQKKKIFSKKKTLKRKKIDRIVSMIITSQYINKSKKKELRRLLKNTNQKELSIIFSKLSI